MLRRLNGGKFFFNSSHDLNSAPSYFDNVKLMLPFVGSLSRLVLRGSKMI